MRAALSVGSLLLAVLAATTTFPIFAADNSDETVTFQMNGPSGETEELTGILTRPPGNGKFPAVVLLHGCGGIHPSWGDAWARRIQEWGYVAFQVDSFEPRGSIFPTREALSAACQTFGTVGAWTRAYDAHAARVYLAALPFVHRERIAVMGQSQGGDAVLWAVSDNPRYPAKFRYTDPFAAAIALYPYCFNELHRLGAPLLILIGKLDYSTPAYRCERMKLRDSPNHAMRLKIYPDAHHGFDVDAPKRIVTGQTMAYHAVATRNAIDEVKKFFGEYLKN